MFARLTVLFLFLFALAAFVPAARGQVALEVQPERVVIRNAGYEAQSILRRNAGHVAGKGGGAPAAAAFSDSSGTGGNPTGGDGEAGDETVIIVGGYQDKTKVPPRTGGNPTGGDGEAGDETVIIVGGYQDVLDYLETTYGAIVEHDDVLGVDLIRLQGFDDPLQAFVDIILGDSLNGRPLIDYLRMMEVVNIGQFGDTLFPSLPTSTPGGFPDDEHFRADWAFRAAGFDRAHWQAAHALHDVKVGLIDAGVRSTQQSHPALDGLAIEHVALAPSADLQVPHALGLASLFGDAGNDGSGSVGLLGAWTNIGCVGQLSYFAGTTPSLVSYNVGDWGPSSLYVARAILASVESGAHVLNLSFRLGYSPVVHDAIRTALEAGVVVVAAAGNYGSDAGSRPAVFPASVEGVIAVGAAEPARRGVGLAPFSAREGVDIAAPGTGIVLGGPDGIWYSGTGTSYAAAYVTAAVAMMKAADPGLSPAAVLHALVRGASSRADGVPFLDAYESLRKVQPRQARSRLAALRALVQCLADQRWDRDDDDDEDGHFWSAHKQGAEFGETPEALALGQNYPNPFNPSTRIEFELPATSHVSLTVYDVMGREVARLVDDVLEPGSHTASFDGTDLASGTYLYRLVADGVSIDRTMVLMK